MGTKCEMQVQSACACAEVSVFHTFWLNICFVKISIEKQSSYDAVLVSITGWKDWLGTFLPLYTILQYVVKWSRQKGIKVVMLGVSMVWIPLTTSVLNAEFPNGKIMCRSTLLPNNVEKQRLLKCNCKKPHSEWTHIARGCEIISCLC